jgi:2-methylcitrate dehydratase PrpD
MSVLRELAVFVCGASVASLPAAERSTQRRHVADTLVAAVAGNRTSEGRALRALFAAPALADAIGMQAAVIRHTEIDDIHLRSCTTPSSVVVPAALSLARDLGDFDPEHVASAMWAGIELMTRFGAAVQGPKILYRGIWPTYLAAPLGAAAVAARMWRLSEDATAHALSLALMLAAGRSGRFHGKLPGRSLLLAIAVTAGIRAAAGAQHGVGGDPDLLDGPMLPGSWLRDAQGLDADLGAMTARLGDGSVYREMSLKPFCSAKQSIAAIEALMALIDGGLSADTITHVRVRVPPPYARMIAMKAEAGSRSSTLVSVAFQLGLAAERRQRLYDIERSDVTQDAAVQKFAQLVEVVPDENLHAEFPASWPAEIEVDAGDQIFRRRVTAAAGDPTRPLDDAQLLAKARRVFAQFGEPAAAGRLVDIGLKGLDDKNSCKQLADAMWDAGVA